MPLRLCAEMSWSKLPSNARACSRWQSWAGQDVFLSALQANALAWPLPVLLSWLVTHCTHTSSWQYRLQLLLSQPAVANSSSRKDMFLQYSRCWTNGLSFLWKRNFTNPQRWTSGHSQAFCSLRGWGNMGCRHLPDPHWELRGAGSYL